MVRRLWSNIGRACFLAALAHAGCEKPVPKTPTFADDVGPIFAAHCVRCHGAGGTLNSDPRAVDPDMPSAYLTQYADKGDCTLLPDGTSPATCIPAARFEAVNGNIKLYLEGPLEIRMPPAPGEPLSSWELDVINNWLAEQPVPMP